MKKSEAKYLSSPNACAACGSVIGIENRKPCEARKRTYCGLSCSAKASNAAKRPMRLLAASLAKTRVCFHCKLSQPIGLFRVRNPDTGSRYTICAECRKSYGKKHYETYSDYYKNKARKYGKDTRPLTQKLIFEYFLTHPCVDCGESDPMVLEFDHVRDLKRHNIAHMMARHSWIAIQKEIKKCEVRCANCHNRRTYTEQNSYRIKLSRGIAQM